MEALHREMDGAVPPDLEVDTVYVGGGTPTVLPADFLCSFLQGLREHADLSGLREATVEANPSTVDADSLRSLRRAGFDRLSLGVQSLQRRSLELLGRTHGPGEARGAFEAGRKAGFDRISVDLIYGIPGQTPGELEEDLRRIIELGPEHVSAYELTLEPGTQMARLCESGSLQAPEEDLLLGMYGLVHEVLGSAGYRHYEVSSYALGDGERSAHNSSCWEGGSYLGLGPSAHSFDGRRRRWWNAPDTAGWTETLLDDRRPPGGGEEVSDRQRAAEMAMLGLRTSRGFSPREIGEETGLRLSTKSRSLLDDLADGGVLSVDGGRISPSVDGMLMADGIAASLEWTGNCAAGGS